jgi:23S rRNA (guanosine2251-2'-O)-methyltransferase
MKRILAGPNAVLEAIAARPREVNAICLAAGLKAATAQRIAERARRAKLSCETVSRSMIDAAAPGLNHQGVIAITGSYPYLDLDGLLAVVRAAGDAPLLVVLDQLQDPGNLGAIIRSAHALGAAGLVLTRDRSAGLSAGAVRASAGASELTRIARVTNLARCLERLAEERYRIYGAAGEADTPLDELDWTGPIALVLGNEQRGLRRLTRERCDALFAIPLAHGFDSLNVSAAAAVALYRAAQHRAASR